MPRTTLARGRCRASRLGTLGVGTAGRLGWLPAVGRAPGPLAPTGGSGRQPCLLKRGQCLGGGGAPDSGGLRQSAVADPGCAASAAHTARVAAVSGAVGGSVAATAHAVNVPVERVIQRLDSWPGVYRDDRGHVVGFWGHALSKLEPEYRLGIDGRTTYAWCALDTLFIPPIVGKPVRVEASDPLTSEAISLVVDREGAHDVKPTGAVVSMVVPDGPFGYDVIETFCHRVLFFASEASGARWTAEHEGTTLLSVEDVFELGRWMMARIAPDIFDEAQSAKRAQR